MSDGATTGRGAESSDRRPIGRWIRWEGTALCPPPPTPPPPPPSRASLERGGGAPPNTPALIRIPIPQHQPQPHFQPPVTAHPPTAFTTPVTALQPLWDCPDRPPPPLQAKPCPPAPPLGPPNIGNRATLHKWRWTGPRFTWLRPEIGLTERMGAVGGCVWGGGEVHGALLPRHFPELRCWGAFPFGGGHRGPAAVWTPGTTT